MKSIITDELLRSMRNQAKQRPLYQAIVDSIITLLVAPYVSDEEAIQSAEMFKSEYPLFQQAVIKVVVDNGLLRRTDTNSPRKSYDLTQMGRALAMQLLTERMLGSTDATIAAIASIATDVAQQHEQMRADHEATSGQAAAAE